MQKQTSSKPNICTS